MPANGMCAASHPLAAQVAVKLLQDGGNAVDAAIAAAVLLGFSEPPACGLGGDAFVLLKPRGERAAGRAQRLGPGAGGARRRGAARRRARHDADPRRGGGDGAGRGRRLRPARRRLGPARARRLPRAGDRLCRGGRAGGAAHRPRLAAGGAEPERRGARPLPPRRRAAASRGSASARPGQAEVLRRIARDGRDGFYAGEVAEDMVASLRALGGVHTLEDFAATACDYVEPIVGGLPRARAGRAAAERPGRDGDPDGEDPRAFRSRAPRPARRGARASRGRGGQARLRRAQPLHRAIRTRPLRLAHMLDDATAARLAGADRPGPGARQTRPRPTEAIHRETVYLCVVDRDRMAVSLIYSIFHSFGSGLASTRFGINFQNRGAGFTLAPGHPERGGGRQAAAAHDHPGDAAPRGAGGDAVRRDGRASTSRPATCG